ncbi:MAG: hypothetical protein MUP22_00960 [Desulfobacterales bacterium]|nr:hypothetical protein [Desulfobacterales bacterium]
METEFSSEQVNLVGESAGLVSFNGTVTEVDENLLVIFSEEGDEITIENRPWRFAIEAGFFAEIGDSINVSGFYEAAEVFEVSFVQNLKKGIDTLIRESSGPPLWARNGRGS